MCGVPNLLFSRCCSLSNSSARHGVGSGIEANLRGRRNLPGRVPAGFVSFSHRILGLPLLALLLICGCTQAEQRPTATSNTSASLRKVVLQTDWFPQAEHGGFYQALAKGFYAEAGLEVEIRSGGPGTLISVPVAKGTVDFGMNRSDSVLMVASRGLPLVMVAATLQHDAQALMVHADSPVRTFRDLDGLTITANPSMPWISYLQKTLGITFALKPNNYSLAAFLGDKEAIQQCLLTNEPFFAEQNGRRVRTLPLADSGFDCYHTIITSRELIRTSPEMVRAFVGASVRGWRDYIEADPAPAHDLIRAHNQQMSSAQLEFSRHEMIRRSLVTGFADRGESIGHLSLPRLAEEIKVLFDLKMVDTPLAVETVATTQFLPLSVR